jgi:SAM-dependent methyltransferase
VVEADIYHLPYADKSFDLVYCWEVMHHIKNMQSAIREMIRLSRHYILMYEPNAFNPLQVGFGLIAPSELGTLRFHPWFMKNHFRRAGLTKIRTFSVGTFTPNRTPLWLYKTLAALPYIVPLFGISNLAIAQVLS